MVDMHVTILGKAKNVSGFTASMLPNHQPIQAQKEHNTYKTEQNVARFCGMTQGHDTKAKDSRNFRASLTLLTTKQFLLNLWDNAGTWHKTKKCLKYQKRFSSPCFNVVDNARHEPATT
jgi:hypothetical protein